MINQETIIDVSKLGQPAPNKTPLKEVNYITCELPERFFCKTIEQALKVIDETIRKHD